MKWVRLVFVLLLLCVLVGCEGGNTAENEKVQSLLSAYAVAEAPSKELYLEVIHYLNSNTFSVSNSPYAGYEDDIRGFVEHINKYQSPDVPFDPYIENYLFLDDTTGVVEQMIHFYNSNGKSASIFIWYKEGEIIDVETVIHAV
mgnify:CR=1 FL=1